MNKLLVSQINLNALRIFFTVYQHASMTEAAKEYHLTQSGVSQHIHALEECIGKRLFTRFARKIVPTPTAHDLYGFCFRHFSDLEKGLNLALQAERAISGRVRIGMPIEFGNNILIPILSEIGIKYPQISFEVTLDYASILQEKIIKNELDFAFLDEAPKDPKLNYEAVSREKVFLCASNSYIKMHPEIAFNKRYFESLDYVEYKGEEPIIRRWMSHHLKRKNLNLNVRVHIMDVQGVAKFIASGLGVGALPDHVVKKMIENGNKIHIFEGRTKPMENEIRLARLKKHPLSSSSEVTLNEIMKSLRA